MRTLAVFVVSGLSFALASSHAYAQSEFVVVSQKVNPVMQPKTTLDVFKECANNTVCSGLVSKAVTYLGVPPNLVSAAMALVPQAQREGEEGRFAIALPSGYQYCRSQIHTISVVPATGDRASLMSATSNKNGVGIYTWTPKRGSTEGRSWVEADYTVYGVRDDIADQKRADNTCRPIGKTLIDCRGARGTNKGKPSCGSVDD